MQSFYGGKPGKSFLIVQRFKSQTEMNEAFAQGANYKLVHYGEYVIIDTDDKNDPSNGKVYKRDINGAEYFAQIVGPSGNATYTHFARYPDIINDNISHNENDLITKDSGEMAVIGHENAPLVPGEYQDSYQPGVKKYNDTIKWATYTVRDKNNRTEDFYIGFSIPYLVLDFYATSVSPQTPLSIERKNANININHPFYDEWNINIPRAKKGNEIKNIRPFNWADANSINDVEYYDGRIDDFSVKDNAPRWIWVGDYYDYSQTETPIPKTIYLGDYIIPKKIEILNNGRIETTYSHNIKTDGVTNPSLVIKNNQEITENSIVKWPADIYIDTGSTGEGDGDQKVYIAWNDGTTTITGNPINYILDAAVDNQNRLLVRYSDPNRRRNGITYGEKTGWTNLGQINFDSIITSATNNSFTFSNIVLKGLIKKQIAGNSILYTLRVTMPMTYSLNLENKLLKSNGQTVYIKYNSNIYEALIPSGTQFTQYSQGLTFTITLPSTLINDLSTSMQNNTIDCCDIIIEYLVLQLTSGE